ncbi:DUF1284 domain-containing protein [uncultured Devosia sp.]|uniref:DUF1284 domain-containing protein n=1 Tax=uncultured Devosia sp. TaxID=211434 RepID=UPI00343F14AF
MTYIGRGYSPAFVENYDRIVALLAAGEAIQLVEGPDDICGPLLGTRDTHCHNESVVERDRLARLKISKSLGLADLSDLELTKSTLSTLRTAFRSGAVRAACAGCEWSGLCDSVAERSFAGARLV